MADIISLKNKVRPSDIKKVEMDRQRKLRFVQRMLRSPLAAAKCEKCDARINPDGRAVKHHLRVPYQFCPDCSEEYVDYIEQLKGKGNPNNYWHNGTWQKLWRAWIDYQNTLDQFLKSKEFKKLIEETTL
jgi:hypothetical protein